MWRHEVIDHADMFVYITDCGVTKVPIKVQALYLGYNYTSLYVFFYFPYLLSNFV